MLTNISQEYDTFGSWRLPKPMWGTSCVIMQAFLGNMQIFRAVAAAGTLIWEIHSLKLSVIRLSIL